MFRSLRRVGLMVKPPVFQPFWFNLLIVFFNTGIPLNGLIVIWPLFYPNVPAAGLFLFAGIATLACAGLALFLSLGWWYHGRKLNLPGWDEYGNNGARAT